MTRFLSAWVFSAAALAVTAWLLGDHMNIGEAGDSDTDRLLAVAVVAAIFTVINIFVAPVVKALSLPFIILSLGLALLVINALLLLLTGWITDKFGVHFFIDGFWWAMLGSIVISIVNTITNGAVKRRG